MPYDFSEIFTAGVREMLPRVQAKKLVFSFDCRGPQLTLPGDPQALRCGLHRLLCGLLDLVEVGFLIFDAETGRSPDGAGLARIKLAGTGLRAPAATTAAVLGRLALEEMPPTPADPEGSHRAAGRCPRTGARIEFTSLPKDGVIFSVELVEPQAECWEISRLPDAAHAPAWVINENVVGARSIARRLQRLGWAPVVIESAAQARELLRARPGRGAVPALVIAFESPSLTREELVALDRLLPGDTQRLHAVPSGSAVLAEADGSSGFTMRIYPLSPWELHELTARHCKRFATPLGPALPRPVMPEEPPRLLVVDDNPLTRLVARGLGEALGYEVLAVADGPTALETCADWSPDVVLMDVHMEPLSGPDTTRRLRQLQSEGEIAPCTVVAATADDREATRRLCRAAGMDGHLSKPLLLSAMSAELQRVCAGHGRQAEGWRFLARQEPVSALAELQDGADPPRRARQASASAPGSSSSAAGMA